MWVKICANTTLEDARAAAEAGADAVGFVFAPSKRQVTAQQVREISLGLPLSVARVGVFGELPAEDIAAAAQHAQLTAIQLHGTYEEALGKRLTELLGPAVSLIQAVHWSLDQPTAAAQVSAALSALEQSAPSRRALLDAKAGGASGGLGLAFDWLAAGEVFARHKGVSIILAGGLRPDTVAEAIRATRPWGVDVASGVEHAPGRKDLGKVREFIKNARGT